MEKHMTFRGGVIELPHPPVHKYIKQEKKRLKKEFKELLEDLVEFPGNGHIHDFETFLAEFLEIYYDYYAKGNEDKTDECLDVISEQCNDPDEIWTGLYWNALDTYDELVKVNAILKELR